MLAADPTWQRRRPPPPPAPPVLARAPAQRARRGLRCAARQSAARSHPGCVCERASLLCQWGLSAGLAASPPSSSPYPCRHCNALFPISGLRGWRAALGAAAPHPHSVPQREALDVADAPPPCRRPPRFNSARREPSCSGRSSAVGGVETAVGGRGEGVVVVVSAPQKTAISCGRVAMQANR